MADLSLVWADDLQADQTGDLLSSVGTDEMSQRIIRRFLTTPQTLVETTGNVALTPDYIFEPSYGGGARAYVGQVINSQVIKAVQNNLTQQAKAESDIDPATTNITVTAMPNGIAVSAYISLNSGAVVSVPQLAITS